MLRVILFLKTHLLVSVLSTVVVGACGAGAAYTYTYWHNAVSSDTQASTVGQDATSSTPSGSSTDTRNGSTSCTKNCQVATGGKTASGSKGGTQQGSGGSASSTGSGTANSVGSSGSGGSSGGGSGADSGCSVSVILVNSCRPWLGAESNNYPGHTNTGLKDEILYHEARIGRQVELAHAYNNPGSVLTSDEKYFVNRPGTILLLNWKPSYDWSSAAGGDASVNTQIDNMAKSIKAMAPHKIMLIVFHEPENDITPGTTTCSLPANVSSAGSPADYVNMWHNVRARFDALGVKNVVWGINYMNYPGGTCVIKSLWPGNSYVDWVWSDPYVDGTGSRPTYTQRMDFTYDWYRDNSDATHDFNSKPWGFAEWGVHLSTQAQAYADYQEAKADLDSNRYPNLKAYVIFDSSSGPKGGGAVGLADDGTPDPTEQQYYNAFANDSHFTGSYTSLP